MQTCDSYEKLLTKKISKRTPRPRKQKQNGTASLTHEAKIQSSSAEHSKKAMPNDVIIIEDDIVDIKIEKTTDENDNNTLDLPQTTNKSGGDQVSDISVSLVPSSVEGQKTPKFSLVNKNISTIRQSSKPSTSVQNSSPSVFEGINVRLIYSGLNFPNTPQQVASTSARLTNTDGLTHTPFDANKMDKNACTPPLIMIEQMDNAENSSSQLTQAHVNTQITAYDSEGSQYSGDNFLQHLFAPSPSSNFIDRGVQCTPPRLAEIGVNTTPINERNMLPQNYVFQHDFLNLLGDRLAMSPTYLNQVITEIATNFYEIDETVEPNQALINYHLCPTPENPVATEIPYISPNPTSYDVQMDSALDHELSYTALAEDIDLFGDTIDFDEKDATSSDYSEVSGSPKENNTPTYGSQLRNKNI